MISSSLLSHINLDLLPLTALLDLSLLIASATLFIIVDPEPSANKRCLIILRRSRNKKSLQHTEQQSRSIVAAPPLAVSLVKHVRNVLQITYLAHVCPPHLIRLYFDSPVNNPFIPIANPPANEISQYLFISHSRLFLNSGS